MIAPSMRALSPNASFRSLLRVRDEMRCISMKPKVSRPVLLSADVFERVQTVVQSFVLRSREFDDAQGVLMRKWQLINAEYRRVLVRVVSKCWCGVRSSSPPSRTNKIPGENRGFFFARHSLYCFCCFWMFAGRMV